MGFERDEVPSQVKGSALVGLGKAQIPQHAIFQPQAEKNSPNIPRSPLNGFRKEQSPFAGREQRPCRPGQSPVPTHAVLP